MTLIETAYSWLDTPYHHHARVKGVGVDCAQLIIGIAEECGYLPQGIVVDNYSQEWHLHNREEKMLGLLELHGCKRKDVLYPNVGDILCFQFGRVCSHLGLYVGNEQFIHARLGVHKVVLNTLSGDWARRHVLTYILPEKMK